MSHDAKPLEAQRMDALAAPITAEEMTAAQQEIPAGKTEKPKRTPIFPVPPDAPEFNFAMPDWGGAPATKWPYHNPQGELMGYLCRWNVVDKETGEIGKKYLPVCYCELDDGRFAWRSVGMPEPRSLYRVHEIIKNPDLPILINEGEKSADAAQILFPGMVSSTPMHGAKSPHKTDWSYVKGRDVIIAGDVDEAGDAFCDAVHELCVKAGAKSAKRLQIAFFGNRFVTEDGVQSREGKIPEGYDLADALAEGWTVDMVQAVVESSRLINPYLSKAMLAELNKDMGSMFRITARGVEYLHGSGDKQEWRWLCSYLVITYQTRDANGGNWGCIIEIIDNDGRRKEYVMPMSMLAGDGVAYREQLLSSGVRIASGAKGHLQDYINSARTKNRATCVNKTGWFGATTYVLPHKVYGVTSNERVVLQSEIINKPYIIKGSLEDWQQGIGSLAVGNSKIIFVIALALAGPLLELLGEENFGIHFVGRSSIGKTALLEMAQSATGSPLHTWRTTDNAAEALARAANDSILLLDEIGQVDGYAIYNVAYMLGNGQGKARGRRDGSARYAEQFNLVFLSSGEMGLSEKIAEVGKETRAGQTVRFIDIPADAGMGLGAFENIHHFDNGHAFAVELKRLAGECSGAVMDAFLEQLTSNVDATVQWIRSARQAWADTNMPESADGQVARVAQKFALIAAVGEYAIHLGILPWEPGSVNDACVQQLAAWLKQRGGNQAHEYAEAERRLRLLISQHGSSRFEAAWGGNMGSLDDNTAAAKDQRIIQRAGFKKLNADDEWEYYILPDVFIKEVIGTQSAQDVKKYLADRGLLTRDTGGKFTVSVRVPGFKQTRYYHVPASIIAAENEDTP